MVYHAVLPMGGAHLTEDLAQAMEIRGDEAEQLKRCFVLGADRFDLVNPPEFYDESGRRLDYKAEFVKECMKTGVDELCGMIQMTIEDAGDAVLPRSQVYLTGGGCAHSRRARISGRKAEAAGEGARDQGGKAEQPRVFQRDGSGRSDF